MEKLDYLIVPLTELDREKLGMQDEFGENGTIGMMFVPSRVRESVKRWQKYESPDPFESGEVADAVSTLNTIVESMRERHTQEIQDLKLSHDEALANERVQLTKKAKVSAQAQAVLLERKEAVDQKRLEVKQSRIVKLENEAEQRKEQALTYYRDFGEARERPLNWFQRIIGKLFRIVA